ncbi:MAG: DegV family protein [Eggerthellaceae bacterium]
MAPKCNLIIDSCCDLPMSMVDKPGVRLIEYPYQIDGEQYYDDLFTSISPHEFYDRMRNGAFPQTSQVPLHEIQDAWTEAAESGVPTLYLSFTSGLTGSVDQIYRIMNETKERYPEAELYLFDTLQASTAEAMLVYEALKQRDKGLTAPELITWAEGARSHLNDMFMVDDLTALKKGGRIPPAAATIGSKLDVKPMLTINLEGSLSLCGMARGRKKAIKQLVGYFTERIPEGERDRTIFIGHADCPDDVERFANMLKKVAPGAEIIVVNVGPVIGSHVGPGMMSLVFFGPERKKSDSIFSRFGKKRS